jgi:thiamine pyrophosphate-dependent acetolactate synthase large subunit-like protein
MIISGGGVIRANASEELRAFARAIRAPVACTMMGLGSIGGDDPLFLGLVGMYGSNAANAACGMCDLLIAVGMRFSDRVAPCPELFARGAKIVHIDIDRAEIDKNVITAHHITGDAKIVLRRLLQKLPGGAGLGGMARDGAAAGAWLGMAKPPPGGAAAGSASAAGAAAAAGCNVGAMAGATACAATGAANVANAAVGETSAAGATAGAAAGTTGALAGKAASVAGAAAAAGSNFGAMAGAAAGAAAGATSAAGIAGATAKGASAAANCAGGAQPGGAALSPRGIIASVQRHAGDGAVIVTDVGQHQLWAAQYYSFASPRTFITSGGYGAMGFGLGAAIGAHIGIHGGAKPPPRKSAALPRVVLITGDGSFRMNLTELSTLRCYGLPIIIVIVNNKSLGMVRQWQRLSFGGRFSYTDLEREPDFVKLAGAYGIPGYKAASPAELDGALGAAVASGRAAIVECALPKDELVAPTGAPDAAPADAPTGVPDDGAR